jgi:hypothetical protein
MNSSRTSGTVSLVPLLLLMACAPSAPNAYERGTLSRHPAPAQRPGVGAPAYDPRSPGARPEPGPRPTRILPQTPESRRGPGLWATRDPLADMPARTLFGVPLPDPGDAEAKKIRAFCARSVALASRHGEHDAAVSRLVEQERRCLAARLYHMCASELLGDFEKTAADAELGVIEHVAVEAMRKTEPVALDFVRRECRPSMPSVEVLAHDIGAAWRKDVLED